MSVEYSLWAVTDESGRSWRIIPHLRIDPLGVLLEDCGVEPLGTAPALERLFGFLGLFERGRIGELAKEPLGFGLTLLGLSRTFRMR